LFAVIILKNIRLKIFLSVAFAVLFFLTYSRGGFIALFITVILFSFRKMKLKYIGFFIAAVIIGVILIPKNGSEGINLLRTSSINTRFIDYGKAISIWKKSPVTGIGYNHIRFEKDSYEEKPIVEKFNPSHASSSFHSTFLMILVTSGVVALLLFVYLLWSIAKISVFAFYSIVFLSVFSLFDNLLLHPFVLFLLFILIPISVIRPSRT
jgi:O-antigen ligase